MCKGDNMNKLKFIPILAAVALLSACEAKASAYLKAPKFAKEGEECEAEVAFNKVLDGLQNLDTQDSKFIGSKVASYYNATQTVFTINRDGKFFEEHTETNTYEMKLQSDFNNKVITVETEKVEELTDKTLKAYSYSERDEETTKMRFQKATYGNVDYYVCAHEDTKVADLYGSISNPGVLADEHDYFTKGHINYEMGINLINEYLEYVDNVSEETFANFKFFDNDNISTMTYAWESDEMDVNTSGENPVTYAKKKESSSEKFQFTFNNGNFKAVFYAENTVTFKYLMDKYGYFEGDEVVQKDFYVWEINLDDTNKSLEVLDLTGYIFRD